ncbi:uncharacterized protein LAESUDRAFT_761286 [Laetiporus sulphureus 93-53]|uniref:Uncharacterized protein n=1 Tax=Laetiporus sulphureus 93-53 TaxID=1314785 RepID=A0A165D5A4_9APHY|nr:uncharacterized protein LAESUDRAFT_761286 [Laetiporus sulphureus 93-53]KZT04180.1 hypothetical protein LAESUDRAFT_761286 [Laetiporus sulphureus 93-53]
MHHPMQVLPMNKTFVESVRGNRAHHCGGLREKAMRLSNQIFGFPALDALPPSHHAHAVPPLPQVPNPEPGRVSILPYIGTPIALDNAHTNEHSADTKEEGAGAAVAHDVAYAEPLRKLPSGLGYTPEMGPVRIVHMNGEEGYGPRMRFRHRRGPFLRRIHFALMALGPWEGRAVAFVLGCGIGVLLRMVWVLGVVVARSLSGRRTEEPAESVFDIDAEDILVPPPQYTDEKVALIAAEQKITPTPQA